MNIFHRLFQKPLVDEYEDYTIEDLDVGFVFDYNLQNWIVKKVYYYDWGNENICKECLIDSGSENFLLYVNTNYVSECFLKKEIDISKIDTKLSQLKSPPSQIAISNKLFDKLEEKPGYFSFKRNSWKELIQFKYINKEENSFLIINQTDEFLYNAYDASSLNISEISNIYPSQD